MPHCYICNFNPNLGKQEDYHLGCWDLYHLEQEKKYICNQCHDISQENLQELEEHNENN